MNTYKKQNSTAYYGIGPYSKTVNNMPKIEWKSYLKIGDTIEFEFNSAKNTFKISSKENRFSPCVKIVSSIET